MSRVAAAPGAHSRNMLTALVGNAFPALVALATGPILAHALGVDGRGAVAAAAAPMTLAVTVATFGVPEAVTFAVARSPRMLRAAAGRGALLLVASGIIAMLAVSAASVFLSGGRDDVRALILIASLAIVPNLLVGVLRGVASALGRWRLVATERIAASLLRLVVLIPFWVTDTLSPLVATLSIACMPVVGGLVYLSLVVRRGEPRGELTPETRFAGLAGYGSRVWIGSLSGILLSRLDQTLMTPLAGTYALGLYVVAVSVSELPLIINMAIRDVTFVSDAKDSADERLAAAARISTTLCLVAGLAIGVSMIWWLPLLFGEDFAPAVPVAAVLLAAVVLGTPGSVGGTGLGARGRPGLRSWSLVVACLLNLAVLIALAPVLGAMGAAIATLVGNLVASNLNLVFLSRFFGVPVRGFYGLRRSDLTVLAAFARRLLGPLGRRRQAR